MKAKDKKLIAAINEKIEVLVKREAELEAMFDAISADEVDLLKAKVAEFGDEYENIDHEIMKLRDEIRVIRQRDLIDRGYYHSMNLAAMNID